MLLPQTISSPCFGPARGHSPTHSWLSYRNPSWALASFAWLVFGFSCLFHAFLASVTHHFSTTASEQMAAPAPTAHGWWTRSLPDLLPPLLYGPDPRCCSVPSISSSGTLAEPGGTREAQSHLPSALRQRLEQEGFLCFAQIGLFAVKHQSVTTDSR